MIFKLLRSKELFSDWLRRVTDRLWNIWKLLGCPCISGQLNLRREYSFPFHPSITNVMETKVADVCILGQNVEKGV